MDVQLTHLEEYKALREEIMQHIREIYRTELICAVAVGVTYTWLLLHKESILIRLIYFIPPVILLVGALRCFALIRQIKTVSEYFICIEEAAFGQDTDIPDWEHFLRDRRKNSHAQLFDIVAASVWVIAIVASIAVSWIFSQWTAAR